MKEKAKKIIINIEEDKNSTSSHTVHIHTCVCVGFDVN